MEDVLTEPPPPSRFFPEDLDNFAAPPPRLSPPRLVLNPNTDPALLSPSFLAVAISAPSLAALRSIGGKSLIGTLVLPELPLAGSSLDPSCPRGRSCNVYAVDRHPAPPAILVAVQYPIAEERARAIAKSLLVEFRADRVVVLDSIRSQNYRGRLSVDEALAFKLETSEEMLSGDPTVRGLGYLPSGSVMDGLGAAILGECQMRKIKGTLVATWPANGRQGAIHSLLSSLGLDVGRSDSRDECAAGFGASSTEYFGRSWKLNGRAGENLCSYNFVNLKHGHVTFLRLNNMDDFTVIILRQKKK